MKVTLLLSRQNIKGETLVRVFNKGKGTIRTGARYHEPNDAGSLHTDSPQWDKTPKYIALLNIRSAIEGGENLLINSYLIILLLFYNRDLI